MVQKPSPAKKPAAKTPTAKTPTAKTPTAVKKPAAKTPAVKKPAAKTPAAKKPAVKKPAVKKPAAKKPAVKKPAAKKLGGGEEDYADDFSEEDMLTISPNYAVDERKTEYESPESPKRKNSAVYLAFKGTLAYRYLFTAWSITRSTVNYSHLFEDLKPKVLKYIDLCPKQYEFMKALSFEIIKIFDVVTNYQGNNLYETLLPLVMGVRSNLVFDYIRESDYMKKPVCYDRMFYIVNYLNKAMADMKETYPYTDIDPYATLSGVSIVLTGDKETGLAFVDHVGEHAPEFYAYPKTIHPHPTHAAMLRRDRDQNLSLLKSNRKSP